MNWTKQQDAAIRTKDRSIIVSAAAGSGKTAVLVERLLCILSDPCQRVRADSIVVVTFTNDAAAQMKKRLTDKLTEKLTTLENGTDPEVYDWLLEQRAGLSSAHICTIHSFCFDLIRDNAENCGVSPLFSIAEPAQERIYQQRALQSVMECWSKKTADMELLFSYFCAREDTELESVILEIADYMDTLPFRDVWIKQAMVLSANSDALLKRYRAAFCEGAEELLLMMEQAKLLAASVLPDSSENRYLNIVEEDITLLREQMDYVRSVSEEQLLENPLKSVIGFSAFPRRNKKENAEEQARTALQKLRDLYKAQYKERLVKAYLEPLRYFQEDTAVQQKLIPLLLRLTEEYLTALFQEKQKQNVLSFSDAEELALRLLGTVGEDGKLHRTELAEALSQQISLIMVDEYQDSNNKQDCLFKLLSRDGTIQEDGLHYGTNAFLVGDVKQAIYSFRQANPENFRRVIAESTPLVDCKHSEMALIYLNQNFRSASGVLNFVNSLFHSLMTERCGEVLYDENEQLNFGSQVYTDADGIRTCILLPQPEEKQETDVQAECIADTIHDMLQKQVPVLLSGGHQRPCEPKDFCILLRSVKTHGDAMTAALKCRGIPVMADQESGLLGLPEIHLIWNLLRTIDNPMTDAAMAAVLTSPVYGFTAEDLALLKLHGKCRRLYLQMRTVAKKQEAELSSLRMRCTAFLEQLHELRRIAEQMPLEDCIQAVYDATDLLSLQGLYEDGAQRREHLEVFRQEAQHYRENADLSAQGCLSGWLHYLGRLTAAQKDIEIKPSATDSNCVSVKTIHKSKGLEYPFVFVAHLDQRFNTSSDAKSAIQASEDGLLGLYLYDRERYQKAQSITFQYLLGSARKRQKSEELRLLYVALTRAEQQLFLVMDKVQKGAVKSGTAACNLGELLQMSPQTAQLLAPGAACMQDWLLYYLHSSGEAVHFERAADEGISNTSELVEYRVWTKNAAVIQDEPEPMTIQAEPDESILEQMHRQLAFTYMSPQTTLASKYSVTQLAHPEEIPETAKKPRLMLEAQEAKSLSGADKGSAVHKMMQLMDMKRAAADPAAEVTYLWERGILSEAEASSIEPEKLQTFFSSALYQRIAAAREVQRERNLFVRIGELHLPEQSVLMTQYAGTDGVLIGTMDLLFREDDGWVLVDYKTDYVRRGEELLNEYSLQLGLYQKAAELLLDASVKQAFIYSFTLGEAFEVKLDEIMY